MLVKLRETICKLTATNKEFKAVSYKWVFVVTTCKWRYAFLLPAASEGLAEGVKIEQPAADLIRESLHATGAAQESTVRSV